MTTTAKTRWMGDAPKRCDLCRGELDKAFVDGLVPEYGQWGFMCLSCHAQQGAGLGMGCGQQFTKQANGVWLKTAG